MNIGSLAGEVSPVAMHEAGHAVVAAYLRLPLRSVRLVPWDGDSTTLSVAGYASVGVELFSTAQRAEAAVMRGDYERIVSTKLNSAATMTLAGRATDERFRSGAGLGAEAYKGDEARLEEIADLLQIPADSFAEWRLMRLERARSILRIGYVWGAVKDLAAALERSLRVTGLEVRAMLRARSGA